MYKSKYCQKINQLWDNRNIERTMWDYFEKKNQPGIFKGDAAQHF